MITLHPGRIARTMATVVAALVAASILMRTLAALTGYHTMHGLVRFFDVDQEMNLPTWYSSMTLLFSAVLLALIAAAEQSQARPTRPWFGLSCIFAALSMDEAGSFHEIFIAPARTLLGVDGFLYFAWVVPAAILVLLVAALYLKWFLALPARTKNLVLISAGVFLGGAIGTETVGGMLTSRGQENTPLYIAVATLEETFEMAGVLCWIYTLLDYAASRAYQTTIRFAAAPDEKARGRPAAL